LFNVGCESNALCVFGVPETCSFVNVLGSAISHRFSFVVEQIEALWPDVSFTQHGLAFAHRNPLMIAARRSEIVIGLTVVIGSP